MAGGLLGVVNGDVINNSDWTLWCFVQDKTPEIYKLGPRRFSPGDVDVDLVKAAPPGALNPFTFGGSGLSVWFKFNDLQTAYVSGAGPDLDLDISLTKTSHAKRFSDEEVLVAAGVGGKIGDYFKDAPGWGTPIPRGWSYGGSRFGYG